MALAAENAPSQRMAPPFQINLELTTQLQGIYLLDAMISYGMQFSVAPIGDDVLLVDIFQKLYSQGFVEITGGLRKFYTPTEKGREALTRFRWRYYEILNLYDAFAYVDTGTGEFLFDKYYDLDDAQWAAAKQEKRGEYSRWEDLRLAVVTYKSLNPVEVAFMFHMQDGRLSPENSGWQIELFSGLMWQETIDVCNSAVTWQRLGEAMGDGPEDESIIQEIIAKGMEVMARYNGIKDANARQEAEQQRLEREADQAQQQTTTTVVTEEVVVYETVSYVPYASYYYADPFYVSPYWYDPWWW